MKQTQATARQAAALICQELGLTYHTLGSRSMTFPDVMGGRRAIIVTLYSSSISAYSQEVLRQKLRETGVLLEVWE